MNYDLIIIGAGAAGISSAIYAVSRGLEVLVLEKSEVGGLIGKVSTVTHYTSVIPQETGATFSARMKQQALDSGVNIQYETVTSVKLVSDLKKITLHDNIIVKPHASLTGMFGEDSIEFLEFTDLLSGENEIIEAKDCAIFVYAGSIPNTQIYPELDLVGGFIPTTDGETALSGVYAAGDICVKQIRQVATAVSDGAVAGIKAATYVMSK